jgi:hypothetical protein
MAFSLNVLIASCNDKSEDVYKATFIKGSSRIFRIKTADSFGFWGLFYEIIERMYDLLYRLIIF